MEHGMAAGESKIEIQVRSLDGQSTTVSISPERSIDDLKFLLKESFLPAKNCPHFHLFFQGAKMNLESRIKSYSIQQNQFIVLLPFTKKSRIPTHSEPSRESIAHPSKCSNHCTTSSFADSAWSDIMQDLSSLSDSANGNEPNLDSNGINRKERNLVMGKNYTLRQSVDSLAENSLQADSSHDLPSPSDISPDGTGSTQDLDDKNREEMDLATGKRSTTCSLNSKRKRGSTNDEFERHKLGLLRDILCSDNEDFLTEQNCQRVCQVLELVNCLCDSRTANCLLFQELYSDSILVSDTKQCLCPPWLKMILKSFTFLNIFSGFLRMRCKDITWSQLKGAIEQLNSCGIEEVRAADVEHLSVLCSKVVILSDRGSVVNELCDSIAIVDSSAEFEDWCKSTNNSRTGAKQLSIMASINAIKKREKAFKMEIWSPIKLFMGKSISRSRIPVSFSLENLLTFIKMSNSGLKSSEVKHVRTRSKSKLDQSRCKDTSLLLPREMVEHLRKGIGLKGQIVHVEEIGARMAIHAELPCNLLETTKSALKMIGISQLYIHQAESIWASLLGKNVVVATSTSSGKSLCYNLPVLEALSQDLQACALYLFPTKVHVKSESLDPCNIFEA